MSYFKQYDIAIQKTRDQELKVHKYQQDLHLARGRLPGKKKEALDQLAQTREYIGKVKDFRKKENAQHGKVDEQVRSQETRLNDSWKKLRGQAREAGISINKYRHAALESKKLAILKYNYLVSNWWDTAIRGLEESISKQQQYIEIMIVRTHNMMSKAILLGGTGYRKPRVIYHQHKPMSESELYPSRQGIISANKHNRKINDAERKQNAQIWKYVRDLTRAGKKLKQRSDAAHGKIKKAVAERDKQLINGLRQKKALVDHIKKLDARERQLASEQDRMGKASGQLAKQKAKFLQGRARAVAKRKYDKQLQKYLAPIIGHQKAVKIARETGKKPPAPPKPSDFPPKPTFPKWYLKTLDPRIRKIFE